MKQKGSDHPEGDLKGIIYRGKSTKETECGIQNSNPLEGKRGRGRPAGTLKFGKRSPKKNLDILRTKAWAWTCAFNHRENESDKPLTAYSLAIASGWRSKRTAKGHDPSCWQRWLDGEGGTLPATTRIWPEIAPAYLIGPWVNSGDGIYSTGAFVPLWSVLSCLNSDIGKLPKVWKTIPPEAWYCWAPMIVEEDSEGIQYAYENPDHLPDFETFKSIAKLYNFLSIIVRWPKTQPLLALTAAISLAKIDQIDTIRLFDPYNVLPYSLSPNSRPAYLKELSYLNISFDEIIQVAKSYGLIIHDCGALNFEQYKKLYRRHSIVFGGFSGTTEEEWRANFEPLSPND